MLKYVDKQFIFLKCLACLVKVDNIRTILVNLPIAMSVDASGGEEVGDWYTL